VFSEVGQLIVSWAPEPVAPVSASLPAPPPVPGEPGFSAPEGPSSEPSEPKIEKLPIYVTEAPKPTPAPIELKSKTSRIIILIVVILVAAVVIVLFWLRRKPSVTPGKPSVTPRKPSVTPLEMGGRHIDASEPLPGASLKDVGGVTGQDVFEIRKKVTRIGRLAGSEDERIGYVVVNKETISRHHAVIEYKKHSFWITDLGSANATFLNGRRITNEVRLNHGDTISFDTYDFEFVMPGMAEFDKTIVDKTIIR